MLAQIRDDSLQIFNLIVVIVKTMGFTTFHKPLVVLVVFIQSFLKSLRVFEGCSPVPFPMLDNDGCA